MKILRAGLFVWSSTGDIITNGWEFDMEGAPPLTDPRDALAAILNHIALTGGLHACAPADPIAAQGLADDAIERARKAGL